jgi:predicted ATPase
MLSSLYISNFRSLEDFHVPKLGRVNLIVGKNNSGKSSVLEALRIYAGNGNRLLLEKLGADHGEKVPVRYPSGRSEPTGDPLGLFASFFAGRRFPVDDDTGIFIGESKLDTNAILIRKGYVAESEQTETVDGETVTRTVRRRVSARDMSEIPDESISSAMFISKADKAYVIRFDPLTGRFRSGTDLSPMLPCSVVPTQFVTVEELAQEWDKVVLTEHEEVIRTTLKIIAPDLEDIAFVAQKSNREGRVGMVKLSSLSHPVPINSMGDGVLRVLQLVLKVFPAQGGILLIDEFENGLHYSVQEKVWALLFDLAVRLDIQIFATSHSWDCIESFANVASNRDDAKGVLFRVGTSVRTSDHGRVIATVFDEAQLQGITQADVEVR